MDKTTLWNYVDKLASMKLSNKAEAERQLGVSLKEADSHGNGYFSFYEYEDVLPTFPNATKADVRISNDGKERWYISLRIQSPACIESKVVMERYPQGDLIPSNPNNLSPDAVDHYKTKIDAGTLIFGFNVKSGCLMKLAFDKTE